MYVIMLFTSVVSIVVILLSYFGFIRYMTLHVNPVDNYIENYSKLQSADDRRVVITFTTTPDRIGKMKPMVKSILDQTVKVDMIAMNIPYNWKGKRFGDIPGYLEKVVNTFRYSKSYGDGGKLIPTLFREKDCDTIIIVVDDHTIYGKDFIATMVEEVKNSDGRVVKHRDALGLTSGMFKAGVIDCDKENVGDEWFFSHCKIGTKTCDYEENHKSLG